MAAGQHHPLRGGVGDLGLRRRAATGLGGAGGQVGRVLRNRGCGSGAA